jgi:hypothetical protein
MKLPSDVSAPRSVPNHDPLKKGTLHGILSDAANARSIPIDEILHLL